MLEKKIKGAPVKDFGTCCNTEAAALTKSRSSRPGDEDIGALSEKHAAFYDSRAIKFYLKGG